MLNEIKSLLRQVKIYTKPEICNYLIWCKYTRGSVLKANTAPSGGCDLISNYVM